MAVNIIDRIIEDAIFPPSGSVGPAIMPWTAVITSTYTVTVTDRIIGVDSTNNGPVTITLPDNDPSFANHEVIIKDETGSADVNPITVEIGGSGNIDGVASIDIVAAYGALRLYCVGGRFGSDYWRTI